MAKDYCTTDESLNRKQAFEVVIAALKVLRGAGFYMAAPFAIALFSQEYRYWYLGTVLSSWGLVELLLLFFRRCQRTVISR